MYKKTRQLSSVEYLIKTTYVNEVSHSFPIRIPEAHFRYRLLTFARVKHAVRGFIRVAVLIPPAVRILVYVLRQ